jgi:hypothetical protein
MQQHDRHKTPDAATAPVPLWPAKYRVTPPAAPVRPILTQLFTPSFHTSTYMFGLPLHRWGRFAGSVLTERLATRSNNCSY